MRLNKVFITLAFILGIAFSTVPTVAASSFTASVTCKGPKFGIIGQSFGYWNWTLNGAPIGPFIKSGIIAASGAISCNANGIIATVTAQIKGCYHQVSASQSFTPGGQVSITVKASCTGNAYGTSVTETGTFTLKN
jgi:hypothetical protein